MAESARAVYYTSDDNSHCVYRLRKSIQSLRQFNQKINVYVAYYGTLREEDRLFFDQHHVTLIYNPEKSNPYLARFQVLENDFPETELLYLDTDTIIFSDIEELFEKTGPQDFHAREAMLTKREGYPYRAGCSIIWHGIVNYELYDSIRKTLGLEILPIFNIGVMIFKNGFHLRLRSYFDQWALLLSMFETKQLPYPCTNPNVSREIVTPMVLAGVPEFSWSFIEPSLSPIYLEYRANDTGTGIVMHILSLSYIAYLLDFAGREETMSYLMLGMPKGARQSFRKLVSKMMLIGGARYRHPIPKKLVRLWVRLGGWLYRSHLRDRARAYRNSGLRSEAA